MRSLKLLICLVFASGAFCQVKTPCPDKTAIAPCKCYENSQQIVCSDPALTGDILHKAFQNITLIIDILHIHDNKQPFTIKAGTFGNSKFNKIFIVGNTELTDIEESAFQNSDKTTALVISNNSKLPGTHLFTLAKQMAQELLNIEFDRNGISEIPAPAFNDPTFAKLKYIRLDAQTNGVTKVNAGAFGQLPELKQLSLDHNKLISLPDNAIDLTLTKLTETDHISLFLNDNNLTDLTSAQVKFPFGEKKPSIGLVLENNAIAKLKDDIFSQIIARPGGVVYLKGNNNITCDCNEVKAISEVVNKPDYAHNIWGLSDTPCHTETAPTTHISLKCK